MAGVRKPLTTTLKLVSLEQALATIRPGSRVYLGTGALRREPARGLEAMQPGPPDVEFVSFVTTSALPMKMGASQTRYRHRTFFVGSDVQSLAESGQLDYVPISLEEVPGLLARGGRDRCGVASGVPARRPRLVSLGVSVNLAPAVLGVAPTSSPRSTRQCRDTRGKFRPSWTASMRWCSGRAGRRITAIRRDRRDADHHPLRRLHHRRRLDPTDGLDASRSRRCLVSPDHLDLGIDGDVITDGL